MIRLFTHYDRMPDWIETAPFDMFFMQPLTVVWKWNGCVHVALVLPLLGGKFRSCIMYAPNPDNLREGHIQGAPTHMWNTWYMPKVWLLSLLGLNTQ